MVAVPLLAFCALVFFFFGPVDEQLAEYLYPVVSMG